ncbi:MAG: winged helix-turn-helix domain-containing protein, partial [Spirochaetaceae bacterium]|nr:winged helix-turn-helix domain-containing protein [Spirochaetaceae bacterium]
LTRGLGPTTRAPPGYTRGPPTPGPARFGGGRGGGGGGGEPGTSEYGTDDLGELADSLGTSYRQLARVVRRFRDEGILEDRRGRIRVLSRERLEPLAREIYL